MASYSFPKESIIIKGNGKGVVKNHQVWCSPTTNYSLNIQPILLP